MTPSAADRISTMMRALAEVVLPAIDPANSLAVEQARLVLGHLAVLSGQGDEARLDALELASEQDLARQLLALPAGGPLSVAACADLSTHLAQSTDGTLAASTRRTALRRSLEALMRAAYDDGSESLRAASWNLGLAHARAQADRARVWYAAAGFESEPQISIPQMLNALERASHPEELQP